MLIDAVSAVLLVSDDAGKLADWYRTHLGFPLQDEVHDGVPLHYGCEIGSVHFAIHPSNDWPGSRRSDSQSPVLAYSTPDIQGAVAGLRGSGVDVVGPHDHGFAHTISFRDPDGNLVEILEMKSR